MTITVETELVETVIAIARQASQQILQVYQTQFSITQKSDNTPLTAADMAAHHAIVENLCELTPDLPVLSEESVVVDYGERERWQQYWLVDPLDGTHEFIKRNGEFSVNIALIDQHLPILGVIVAPVSGECFYAMQGQGAYRISARQRDPMRIGVRPCPSAGMTVARSRGLADQSFAEFLGKIGQHHLVRMGSSLKSCLVAQGEADVYLRLGPTSEWDTAAAQCIVEEAGGHLTDTNLNPLRYNTKASLLNPDFLVYGDSSVNWKAYL